MISSLSKYLLSAFDVWEALGIPGRVKTNRHKLRGILQKHWPALSKDVKVIKDKERLRNFPV